MFWAGADRTFGLLFLLDFLTPLTSEELLLDSLDDCRE